MKQASQHGILESHCALSLNSNSECKSKIILFMSFHIIYLSEQKKKAALAEKKSNRFLPSTIQYPILFDNLFKDDT
jgi:hypothetical protein